MAGGGRGLPASRACRAGGELTPRHRRVGQGEMEDEAVSFKHSDDLGREKGATVGKSGDKVRCRCRCCCPVHPPRGGWRRRNRPSAGRRPRRRARAAASRLRARTASRRRAKPRRRPRRSRYTGLPQLHYNCLSYCCAGGKLYTTADEGHHNLRVHRFELVGRVAPCDKARQRRGARLQLAQEQRFNGCQRRVGGRGGRRGGRHRPQHRRRVQRWSRALCTW